MELPAVATGTPVYKPDLRFETAQGTLVAIAFSVQTNQPDQLGVLLIGGDDEQSLARVTINRNPSATERDALETLADANRSATGSFAILSQESSELRVGVAIPADHVTGRLRVRVFDAVTADGRPIQYDQIEIARDFFYLAVIGDSVIWGNGLREEHKYPTLVAREIEAAFDVHVVLQRYAQNGAPVKALDNGSFCEFDCFPEVPTVLTSLETQATRIERPDLVELVLVQGCINDVGLPRIVDPEITLLELSLATDLACRGRMADFLEILHSITPDAHVLVMGYYPIVGRTSDLFGVEALFQANTGSFDEEEGLIVPDPENLRMLRTQTADRSTLFRVESDEALQAAVAATLADHPTFSLSFLPSTFTAANAVFTSDAFLWGMTNDNPRFEEFPDDLALFPEDDTQDFRFRRCVDVVTPESLLLCLYASTGHPNRAGAASYADVILDHLRSIEFLP